MYWIIKRMKNSKFSFLIMFFGFFISTIALSIGTSTIADINKLIDDCSHGHYKYVKKINMIFQDEYDLADITNILKENYIYSDVAIEDLPFQTENYEIFYITGVLPKDKYLWIPPILKGKFINSTNTDMVAVVGKRVLDSNNQTEISIYNEKYKVIGTCGKSEASIIDRYIFVPINCIPLKALHTIMKSNTLEFVVKNNNNPQAEIDSFSKELLKKYPGVRLTVSDDDRIAKKSFFLIRPYKESLTELFKMWLISIFNIINISYFWIHLRKKEIALRKVLGASKASLYFLILKEIAFICFIASIFAIGFLFLLNKLSIQLFFYTFNFSINIVFLSIIVSLLTCIFTSIIPTIIALKIQPVTTLKE